MAERAAGEGDSRTRDRPDGGGCRVVRSDLGFAAAVRGGAQISLDQVFVDPTVIGRTETGVAQ
jgi:hypothetical protein